MSPFHDSISIKEQLDEAVVFRNSKFINNYVKADYSAYGGAIKSERSIKIENCLFGRFFADSDNFEMMVDQKVAGRQ